MLVHGKIPLCLSNVKAIDLNICSTRMMLQFDESTIVDVYSVAYQGESVAVLQG